MAKLFSGCINPVIERRFIVFQIREGGGSEADPDRHRDRNQGGRRHRADPTALIQHE